MMSVAIVFAVAVVALLAWLAWMEPRLLYYPVRELEGNPSDRGWRFENVMLTASDGVRLHGWFLPADSASSRVTVLFFHGNAGNVSHRIEKLAVFRRLGVDVLIVDYRGYGQSEGKPSEAGTYRDARAAYDVLRARGIDRSRIVVYGESLGSSVASWIAAEQPVGGLILEAPFTSAADVGQAMFPFLPVRWLVRNRYDTLRRIGRIHAPLLILHSRDDEYFPLRHAERLLAAAPEPKRLVVLRGGHNDAFLVSASGYAAALAEFFRRYS
jgi:fermentation-respiration switch protein FrsA (DUF1100 family)